MKTMKIDNDSTGALHVGRIPGVDWKPGMKIRIQGEDKDRIVTYVTPSKDPSRVHITFAGQGILPTGPVTYTILDEGK